MLRTNVMPAAVVAVVLMAAANGQPPPDRGGPSNPGPGRGAGGFQPPRDPIRGVLDANFDHRIDADEIKNASVALLSLDTNGDGILEPDEVQIGRAHV